MAISCVEYDFNQSCELHTLLKKRRICYKTSRKYQRVTVRSSVAVNRLQVVNPRQRRRSPNLMKTVHFDSIYGLHHELSLIVFFLISYKKAFSVLSASTEVAPEQKPPNAMISVMTQMMNNSGTQNNSHWFVSREHLDLIFLVDLT